MHGCVLKEQNNKLWVFREKSAIDNSILELCSIQNWDNRFSVSLKGDVDNYYLGQLTFNEYLSIKDKINLDFLSKISNNNHKLVLFSLPVIKNIEKVVAIPHISYYDGFNATLVKEVVFRSGFISRFTHFL